jgi:hypothetical protein
VPVSAYACQKTGKGCQGTESPAYAPYRTHQCCRLDPLQPATLCCSPALLPPLPPLHVPSDVSHHPGSDNSLLLSSSSGAATGWFLITYRDKERPNSEVRVAPLSDPSQQTVR